MAVILAIAGAAAAAGYVNPHVSAALRSFAVDYWPAHAVDAAPVSSLSAIARVWPATVPAAIAATPANGYMADYYYRVHLIPSRIDLGNLVSAQTRSVVVWNAWPDQPRSLTDLQLLDADGITATGEGALPLAFAPLQQRAWTINVNTDGPGVIAATLAWLFATGDSVQASITGNRLVAWMLPPDWADGVRETLAWLTDVQQSDNGDQLREVLRQAPRRDWQFAVLAAGADRRILESALYDWGARTWLLPVWTDVTWLASPVAAGAGSMAIDTRYLDFAVGSLAMLYRDARHWETVEISAISDATLTFARPTVAGYGVGDRIYPCRQARLVDTQSVSRRTDDMMTATVRMQAVEPCDWPAAAPAAAYLGVPVLEDAADWGGGREAGYARQLQITDNSIGRPDVLDPSGLAWLTLPFTWLLQGRAARAAHRSLLYWLQGRAQALWVPSGAADLTLAAPTAAASATLVVDWAGVTLYQRRQPGRRHLRIELATGVVFYRRILASTDGGDTEQLALDSALGVDVAPADVRQISWLMFATLAGDGVDIMHDTDSMGIARSSAKFAGVPAEEP